MSMTIKEIREYLNDNPEGYWFKRRLYGWGWIPARTEGWLVLAAFLAYAIWVAHGFEKQANAGGIVQSDVLFFVGKLIVSVAILIAICYWKGESPRWQWGLPKDK